MPAPAAKWGVGIQNIKIEPYIPAPWIRAPAAIWGKGVPIYESLKGNILHMPLYEVKGAGTRGFQGKIYFVSRPALKTKTLFF